MKNFFVLSVIFWCAQTMGQSCFIAIDTQGREICLSGSDHDIRFSPCSTFKIALSLMGFDAGILLDEQQPMFSYKDQKIVNGPESWKVDHNPSSWMKNSVVWYSQKLIEKLGMICVKKYLAAFEYGNQDMSGDGQSGVMRAWLCSSLGISAREQAHFMRAVACGMVPVSQHALNMTKNILFEQETSDHWRLYGKSGTGFFEDSDTYSAWYVGWLEKDGNVTAFAWHQCGVGTPPNKPTRINMVLRNLF